MGTPQTDIPQPALPQFHARFPGGYAAEYFVTSRPRAVLEGLQVGNHLAPESNTHVDHDKIVKKPEPGNPEERAQLRL